MIDNLPKHLQDNHVEFQEEKNVIQKENTIVKVKTVKEKSSDKIYTTN
ncbi:MAG: hypothetical protein GY823_05500 [Flavobacteriaceae bacterium]|nr:hypothetical protein [Flavobacteriaceae bacterium]